MLGEDAVAHVRARSGGPLRLGAGVAAPAGMLRLTRPDSTGQALPVWPDAATPSLLDEYQVSPVPVERSGETRRVLAATLKCCWSDLSVDPWPGTPAPAELILDTYRALIGRADDLMRNWAIGALRRLHDSAWIVMSDGVVSLGPRCALWPVESHAQLKELVRRIPTPEQRDLTVVADADIVAAATQVPHGLQEPPTAEQPSAAQGPLVVQQPSAVEGPPTAQQPPEVQATPAAQGPLVVQPPSPEAQEPPSAQQPSEARVRAQNPTTATAVAGRVEGGAAEFDELLSGYDERRRAELVAAFMAVEHGAEPVLEARFGGLRDPALRHTLAEMLARRGRTLIQHRERWTSGYDDAYRTDPAPPTTPGAGAPAATGLGESERAVLTLVLVHSVAIPRAEGLLPDDTWLSPHPTPVDELRRHTQLPIGELEAALRVLRHAGLLTQVKAGEEAGGYAPGPQFHRLTPAARRRLQEELILAAGPHSPLATAVRARRSAG
ncbi:hypothetical protein [Nonomuraea aurantiaca]|uniref:hypothetical protein n=1 Tax=Nonomuraea aurantiaca TaxID=2878562 RepID=UPI001CD9CDFE|nr:hypothetical protein [Nonomuraea aurantiaca]MCA2220507.1 hypothetical protein [Nonomuraea aurantiaca]